MQSKQDGGIPQRTELRITHHKQRYNWDCGLSCVLMVLPPAKREHLLSNFHDICKEEGFNKSTWSIDLCYLLRKYEVQHLYCTVTLGVHPGYHRQTFYEKILQKDEERVTRRFAEAAEKGIRVCKKSLTKRDLMFHLSKSGPVILLTNANLLHCDTCKMNKLTSQLLGWLPWASSYSGHYIVLCGYDKVCKKFLFHNPSCRNRVCTMSYESLDEARQSYGTDEDAILVFNSSWT